MKTTLRRAALAAVCALVSFGAAADEAAIRKNLGERLKDLSIDEVSKTPIAGLYEVRLGNDIFYSDEQGNYVLQGNMIDTRTRADLTQARIDKLSAIDFAALPLKDAVVYKQGTGARKLVVFSDPNCPYCKRFEKDLLNVKDITVYTFLYPILGGDSPDKARDIWCAKDQGKIWREWMIEGKTPPKSMGQCDTSAIQRNTAMARKHKVNGTPAVVFEDGSRVPGALPADQVEKHLLAAAGAAAAPGKPGGTTQ
jgi:thiol:disulfide interchange protein DsbC